MNDQKQQFIFSLIPPGVPLVRDRKSILAYNFVDDTKREEVIVLDVAPSEAAMSAMRNQRSLPDNITFEAERYPEVNEKTGIQKYRMVTVVRIRTAPFRASPYVFWFTAYPRAVTLYVVVVLLLICVRLLL